MWIHLSNGKSGRFAANHRILTSENEWVELQNLTIGTTLEGGLSVVSTSDAGYGPVVKITVEDTHTYYTLGFVSHNIKYKLV
jgi:hypothetical protein